MLLTLSYFNVGLKGVKSLTHTFNLVHDTGNIWCKFLFFDFIMSDLHHDLNNQITLTSSLFDWVRHQILFLYFGVILSNIGDKNLKKIFLINR